MSKQIDALKLALEAFEDIANETYDSWTNGAKAQRIAQGLISIIKEALAQPEQETVAWKLVPTEPTDEMLKAMDECSTEGYDERLYAGHAASVYMAAVDVAPTPPKPEQEPVAWMSEHRFDELRKGFTVMTTLTKQRAFDDDVAIYTTPPQRKPLTDTVTTAMKQAGLAASADTQLDPTWEELEIIYKAMNKAAHGIKE